MEGAIAILVGLCCVLGSAVICLAIIAHDNKLDGSSRPAQRKHNQDYAPAENVYIVIQHKHQHEHAHYHEHIDESVHEYYDNRQVHIYGQEPTLGPGRIEGKSGYTRPALPRQRKARCLPG